MPPAAVPGLTPVPLATLATLSVFQGGERFGLIVLDGALVVGASLALALS